MRRFNSVVVKTAYRLALAVAVVFVMGVQCMQVQAEDSGEAAFELEAGAASLFGVDEILYTQDEIDVSDAEKIYGANLAVLSAEAELWKEIEEKVGTVAVAVASNYVYMRSDADIGSQAVAKAYGDSVVKITGMKENEEDIWYQVESDGISGYIRSDLLVTGEELALLILNEDVSRDYIENPDEWKDVLTKEEEEQLLAVQQAEQQAIKVEAVTGDISLLRQQIVEYSMQFLGNSYVSGGSSLAGGTDCSGFTCFIYKDFGYNIDRTPAGQYNNAGRLISYSEIKPGDIICYGNGSCTHVALYIGNGQIIHSANSRKGVVIYEADYDNIMAVKSILD